MTALSISRMTDQLIRPLLDETHPLYNDGEATRRRLRGLALNQIKDTPSASAKEETKKKTVTKKKTAEYKNLTHKLLSKLSKFNQLHSLRLTKLKFEYELLPPAAFSKLKLLEICY
mmetsp:Transcript_22538/g.25913  ORF Transcript_22538/g.25913 Transcript_22538/m.25913 type:complete len:116 (-) Transcript_22538:59-406(-)